MIYPNDPHSNSRPDLVVVLHTELKLTVDFTHKILKGTALLTFKKECECDELILDTYSLEIINIKEYYTKIRLDYNMQYCDELGHKLIIKIPTFLITNRSTQIIQIEYETKPDSPALYWLTEEQNTSSKPVLIVNTKFIYARAIFPCQDTPSHTALFRMKLLVSEEFVVETTSYRRKLDYIDNLFLYSFYYWNTPSYGVSFVIAHKKIIPYKIKKNGFVRWFEKKYFSEKKRELCYLKKELSYNEFFIFIVEYMVPNLYFKVNDKIWRQLLRGRKKYSLMLVQRLKTPLNN